LPVNCSCGVQSFLLILKTLLFDHSTLLKTNVFIAGKKNPATQIFFIGFSIENLIANIGFYALSWPKLNFTISPLKSFFKLYFKGKTNKSFLGCWIFFTRDKCNCL
jgi:hypothetical protein